MKNDQKCPRCHSPEIKRIIYGMPGADFDFDKYEVGGCLVDDESPKYKCMRCKSNW
jgi:DNA-directed RNA polymerase subunit RPC12/RpoP